MRLTKVLFYNFAEKSLTIIDENSTNDFQA